MLNDNQLSKESMELVKDALNGSKASWTWVYATLAGAVQRIDVEQGLATAGFELI